MGYECVGIDFSPASIGYARERDEEEGLSCRYALQEARTDDYGKGYGLIMLMFGEFNCFSRKDARAILETAKRAP